MLDRTLDWEQLGSGKAYGAEDLLVLLQRIGITVRGRRQHDQTKFGHRRRRDAIVMGHELQGDHAAARGEAPMNLAKQCLARG